MSTVVLLSGGMDSAICLLWAKERWGDVTALSVDYGQIHAVELESATKIAALAEVPHVTTKVEIPNPAGIGESTWLPGRNLVLLAMATTLRPKRIVLGVCQSDEVGYPDCREGFTSAALVAIRRALDCDSTELHCPLMYISKGESVLMATKIPWAWEALALSVTCYKGTKCGECPACKARAAGFNEAGKVDPAL